MLKARVSGNQGKIVQSLKKTGWEAVVVVIMGGDMKGMQVLSLPLLLLFTYYTHLLSTAIWIVSLPVCLRPKRLIAAPMLTLC